MLTTLDALPMVKERAVIINYNTRLVTTLALLSALRYVNMQVLLIDCHSTDGSLAHFQQLQQCYDFDLLSMPLRPHGITLDQIFRHLPADSILLVDSDIEVLSADMLAAMRQAIQEERVFGSGYSHGGDWMHLQKQPYGYYVERCWIPFVLLKTQAVQLALQAGQSFIAETIVNEFPPNTFISKLLIKRFRLPFFRRLRLSFLDRVRQEYFGLKPAFLTYDTGAKLYQYLVNEEKLIFTALSWVGQEQSLTHFHGVTRLMLNRRDQHGAAYDTVTPLVRERLARAYGLEI